MQFIYRITKKRFEECKIHHATTHEKDHAYILEIDRIVFHLHKQRQIKRNFNHLPQQISFLRTFEVLRTVLNLLMTECFLTKCDLFYEAP